jgi:hypothetical protein
MSLKKVEMERRKMAKQQERLLRQGRIRPGKTAGQRELEKLMKPQQAPEPALELARIGIGWFPEVKNADLRNLANDKVVKKGDLEFMPITKYKQPHSVSFVAIKRGPNYEKTVLGSFSVNLEQKIIKRF